MPSPSPPCRRATRGSRRRIALPLPAALASRGVALPAAAAGARRALAARGRARALLRPVDVAAVGARGRGAATLDTREGPAFKPLPVAVCALLAPLGGAAPRRGCCSSAPRRSSRRASPGGSAAAPRRAGRGSRGALAVVAVLAVRQRFLGAHGGGRRARARRGRGAGRRGGVARRAARGSPSPAPSPARCCASRRGRSCSPGGVVLWRRAPARPRGARAAGRAGARGLARAGVARLGRPRCAPARAPACPNPGQPALADVPGLASLPGAPSQLPPWPLWLGVAALAPSPSVAAPRRGRRARRAWRVALALAGRRRRGVDPARGAHGPGRLLRRAALRAARRGADRRRRRRPGSRGRGGAPRPRGAAVALGAAAPARRRRRRSRLADLPALRGAARPTSGASATTSATPCAAAGGRAAVLRLRHGPTSARCAGRCSPTGSDVAQGRRRAGRPAARRPASVFRSASRPAHAPAPAAPRAFAPVARVGAMGGPRRMPS